MKRAIPFAVLTAAGFVLLAAVGCGDQQPGGGGPEGPVRAYQFTDGQPKYYDDQQECPVCGGQPIKEDLHATYQGKRVYFDKQECVDAFEGNPEQHMQDWMSRVEKRRQEQMEQERAREMEDTGGGGE